MLVRTFSVSPVGMEIIRITIETFVAERGYPSFDIVGLAGKEVSESKHRVVTALKSSGIDFPPKKIVINLAPADVPKIGSFFDLPIAVSLISAFLKLPVSDDHLFFGELSLDGSLRYTHGAFLAALHAHESGIENLFIPLECVPQASAIVGLSIFSLSHLSEIVGHFSGEHPLDRCIFTERTTHVTDSIETDLSSIVGQKSAKRALVISAAGRHNLFLKGPPGVGKTLLANAYKYLLPNLTQSEAIEVTKVHNLSKKVNKELTLIEKPPFRSPHHTISYTGMVGGGAIPVPGEVSLAHKGVIFMDEFPEFTRPVLEALRQPLEAGCIHIHRSRGSFVFPCDFTLLAACNPCPCGYLNHPRKPCICSFRQIQNYKSRISGPIMDRIDLAVNLNPISFEELEELTNKNTSSETMLLQQKVVEAHRVQTDRYQNLPINFNSRITNRMLEEYCFLEDSARLLLKKATRKLDLSGRSYTKILKVSRTIADLDVSKNIKETHVLEALQYRL